jgi:hypothetical protein
MCVAGCALGQILICRKICFDERLSLREIWPVAAIKTKMLELLKLGGPN